MFDTHWNTVRSSTVLCSSVYRSSSLWAVPIGLTDLLSVKVLWSGRFSSPLTTGPSTSFDGPLVHRPGLVFGVTVTER